MSRNELSCRKIAIALSYNLYLDNHAARRGRNWKRMVTPHLFAGVPFYSVPLQFFKEGFLDAFAADMIPIAESMIDDPIGVDLPRLAAIGSVLVRKGEVIAASRIASCLFDHRSQVRSREEGFSCFALNFRLLAICPECKERLLILLKEVLADDDFSSDMKARDCGHLITAALSFHDRTLEGISAALGSFLVGGLRATALRASLMSLLAQDQIDRPERLARVLTFYGGLLPPSKAGLFSVEGWKRFAEALCAASEIVDNRRLIQLCDFFVAQHTESSRNRFINHILGNQVNEQSLNFFLSQIANEAPDPRMGFLRARLSKRLVLSGSNLLESQGIENLLASSFDYSQGVIELIDLRSALIESEHDSTAAHVDALIHRTLEEKGFRNRDELLRNIVRYAETCSELEWTWIEDNLFQSLTHEASLSEQIELAFQAARSASTPVQAMALRILAEAQSDMDLPTLESLLEEAAVSNITQIDFLLNVPVR